MGKIVKVNFSSKVIQSGLEEETFVHSKGLLEEKEGFKTITFFNTDQEAKQKFVMCFNLTHARFTTISDVESTLSIDKSRKVYSDYRTPHGVIQFATQVDEYINRDNQLHINYHLYIGEEEVGLIQLNLHYIEEE